MGRIKQFLWDISAPLQWRDDAFLAQFLTPAEVLELNKLRRAEVLHAIRVAKMAQKELPGALAPGEAAAFLKACLLHDVGKNRCAMSPFSKAWQVLFPPKQGAPLSRHALTARDHPKFGEAICRRLDSFPEHPYLYELIGLHQNRSVYLARYEGNARVLFILFNRCDDAN
ncbi:hypothetical protein ABB02_00935 [Clostridiaceae bacterium JG1575]|nr:hypothetical protein ABB02_00935 [Clostridiaceae bacterium JG1575]